jgi:taspase (threonine aspartase 1)
MRTMFTYKCVERLLKEDDIQTAVVDALDKDFLGNGHVKLSLQYPFLTSFNIESPLLNMYDKKSVGTIALRSQKTKNNNRSTVTLYTLKI